MTKPLQQIYDAFVFGFPLYELARSRHNDLSGSDDRPPLPPNTLWHGRTLSGADDRWVTTPNNDTLYSRAWLDLSQGPVRITVDEQPRDCYWSVALMDAMTRNFALLGQRLHGAGPAQLTLVGPGADGIDSIAGPVMQAPSNDVWLLARFIVEDEHDLPTARAMQDRLRLHAAAPGRPWRVVPTTALDPANFLAVVAEQLQRNPLPALDLEWLTRLHSVGLQPGVNDPWQHLPDEIRDAWQMQIASCHDQVRQAFVSRRRQVDHWWVADDQLGDGKAGYEWRACVALGGLGALDADEAVYAARMTDDDGNALHGNNAYCMTVPASGIPAGALWSLSLYELMPDGRKFFAHNPIERYSIGNRTAGLHYEADGHLRIALQQQAPQDPRLRANWLPVPDAAFSLTLRAYLPSAELREWKVALPSLMRIQ